MPQNHQPLVSIIIPTYNYGRFLGEALDSLLAQSYPFWEAIIIDDGSIDDTASIVKPYLDKDERFRYFFQENQGTSGAKNTGLSNFNGEYFLFLDADDKIVADKLAVQVRYMETNPQCDISYTNALHFKHGDHLPLNDESPALAAPESMAPRSNHPNAYLMRVLKINFIPICCHMIRTAFYRKHPILFCTQLTYFEDWDFWLRFALLGAQFEHMNDEKAIALIRLHAHNSTRFKTKTEPAFYQFRSRINNYLQDDTIPDQKKLLAISMDCYLRESIRLTGLLNLKKLLAHGRKFGWIKLFLMYFKELNRYRRLRKEV